MFRKILLTISCFLILAISANAQVGISNTSPEAALDVTSTDSGILIPRVALTSTGDVTTVTNPDGGGDPVVSTLVYNDGTRGLSPAGFYYWNGAEWNQLIDDKPDVYVGRTLITSAGTLNVTEVPFQPKRVTFTAYANIESYTLDTAGSSANNKDNSFGYMKGFARVDQTLPSGISQQVINGGGSGESINNISRYASASHCIGMRYGNQNGGKIGLTTASLTSFDSNGFTLNVDSFLANESLVIIYEAYRY